MQRIEFTVEDYWKVYAFARINMGKMVRDNGENGVLQFKRGKYITKLFDPFIPISKKSLSLIIDDKIYHINKSESGNLYAKAKDGDFIDLSDEAISIMINSEIETKGKLFFGLPKKIIEKLIYLKRKI